MGKHAGVMRAARTAIDAPRPVVTAARARRAGGNGVEPAHDCESMTGLKCRAVSEAVKELDATARSGARVASRWTWPRQSGLSPRGRPLTAS
jgi:hypothetical protein